MRNNGNYNMPLHLLLALGQLLTLAGFVTLVGGLAALQKKANSLGLTESAADAATVTAYTGVFTSAGPINPYPLNTHNQFEYQWFTVFFEFVVCAYTLILLVFPAFIPRARLPALVFLAPALGLIFENVNAILYLHRNATANTVFGRKRISVSLAALIIVGIGNGLTIIALGLWAHDRDDRTTHQHNKGSVAPEVGYTVNQGAGNEPHLKTEV